MPKQALLIAVALHKTTCGECHSDERISVHGDWHSDERIFGYLLEPLTLSLPVDPRRHEGEDIGHRGVRGPAGDGASAVAAPLRPGILGGGVSQGPQGK